MSSKMKIVLALVVMLSVVGAAQAGLFWGNASGDWAAETTWHDHAWADHNIPSPIFIDGDPQAQDTAITIGGVTINVTTAGQGTVDLYHGYHVGVNNLNIAAGKYFQVTHLAQVGLGNDTDSDATGILNVNGSFYSEGLYVGVNKLTTGIVNVDVGGSVNVGGWDFIVGRAAANTVGTGTINIKGGTMAVASTKVAINSKGRINIESGTLLLSNPIAQITIGAMGRIDITGGALLVQDDASGSQMYYYIQPYIDSYQITGYGGAATLTVDVNSTTHIVKITAPTPPMATSPTPADKQRHVAANAVLSWVSPSTTSHDVYLGTDVAAVTNATLSSPEFKSRQTATTYNPGGLVAGQVYYWRIDEFDGTVAWKGTVWSFATGRTAPIVLTKGITLDRQFATIPPEEWNRIDAYDVALIKRMGFNFAKVLVNPQPMIHGNTIWDANMAYVDELVNGFLDQGVPVVVCIHPEAIFKQTYLGSAGGFTTLLSFYHDFAGYLATRWNQNEVVFQLMTEPFNNYTDWNTMLPQMVSSVRSAMPSNTLIIGGAQVGTFAGLTAISQACINAINDNNVYYGFTYWNEEGLLAFEFQGGGLGAYYPYLKNVPYPSSTSNNAADYILPTCPPDQYNAALAAVNTYCQKPWNMAKQQSVLQPIIDWKNARGGNLKLICYEMGVPIDPCQATAGGGVNPPDRIQYIHDKRLALEEKNIGWTYWSYNETFTVLNYPLRVAFEKGVTKDQISSPTLTALGLPCGCGCITDEHPAGDINADCYVNFKDFAAVASGWLKCNEPTNASCVP